MRDNFTQRAAALIEAVTDYAIFRVSVDGIIEFMESRGRSHQGI